VLKFVLKSSLWWAYLETGPWDFAACDCGPLNTFHFNVRKGFTIMRPCQNAGPYAIMLKENFEALSNCTLQWLGNTKVCRYAV
jgi:hypothetical protein